MREATLSESMNIETQMKLTRNMGMPLVLVVLLVEIRFLQELAPQKITSKK
jgi:hypothetical protein